MTELPRAYNAAVDLLERDDPDRLAIIDDAGRYTYGEVARARREGRRRARRARRAARAARRAVHARLRRLRRDVPRRDLARRGAGAAQHAAHRRRLPLPDRRQPRARRDRERAAARQSCRRARSRRRSGASRSRPRSRRRPRRPRADDVAFWLYSSGSTGKPKGAMHLHGIADPDRGALRRSRSSGSASDDVVFSAAKLFFAYGLGNALTFPLSVGATAVLTRRAARRRRRCMRTLREHHADDLLRRADAVRGAARRSVARALRRRCACRIVAPARRCRSTSASAGAQDGQRHPRRHRLDGDAAHLPLEPARRRRATARPAARCPATSSSCATTTARRSPTARRARCGCAARPRCIGVLERPRAVAARPSTARGRAPATATSATRTATGPTAAARTTCSRSAASGSRRSRSRARSPRTRRCSRPRWSAHEDADGLTKPKAFVVLKSRRASATPPTSCRRS